MRSLKIVLVVALGAVLFSSCSKGYGCYYGQSTEQELSPEKTQTVFTKESTSQETYTVEVAR